MKHADFIVEAVVEDEGVKRNIFQQLDKVGLYSFTATHSQSHKQSNDGHTVSVA